VRRILIALAVVFALLVIGLAVAVHFVDAESLRGKLQDQASAALGREVTLGKISLGIFPLPAVEIGNVRVAGPKPSDPPLADISELRLRLAVLPLLIGKIVFRTLELDSPKIDIPFDKDGKPILPGPAAKPKPKPESAPDATAEKPAKPATGSESAGLALAVDRIAIRDASVRAGPWQVEHGKIEGRLSLDGSGAFKFSALLPGLGELRSGEVELAKLSTPAPKVDARGEFSSDLAELRKRFTLPQELSGKASGEYSVELAGSEVRAASASIDVPDLLLRADKLVVSGPARGHMVLGESFSFDLSDARIEQSGVFAKPKRTTLSVTGKLGREASLAALREAVVKIGGNEIPLTFALGAKPQTLHVGKTTLYLDKLRELLPPDKPELSGRVGIQGFDVQLSPLRVTGDAQLADVEAKLAHGPVQVSGPLRGRGESVGLEKAEVTIGGQKLALTAGYVLATGAIRASFDTQKSALGQMLNALAGRSELDGTLTTNGSVETEKAGLETLAGRGRLEIRPGKITGFSLGKSVLGELAALPQLALAARGKDMSKYAEENFDHLTSDYTIADGKLHTENLELAYNDVTAYLHGSIGLWDRSLDLAGKVVISKKADSELAGAGRAKERTIPITHLTGTYDSPRVELDGKTLAALALTYAGSDKLQKKLDKALGPGAGEAVQGVLEGILGGGGDSGKKPRDKKKSSP
jgi:uncharacterized protein involved in outer membrane biogenesis